MVCQCYQQLRCIIVFVLSGGNQNLHLNNNLSAIEACILLEFPYHLKYWCAFSFSVVASNGIYPDTLSRKMHCPKTRNTCMCTIEKAKFMRETHKTKCEIIFSDLENYRCKCMQNTKERNGTTTDKEKNKVTDQESELIIVFLCSFCSD